MSEMKTARRIIYFDRENIRPIEPKQVTIQPRKESDFSGIPKTYIEVAKKYTSPLHEGPPLCDELLALVKFMLTEEEAEIMACLSINFSKSAKQVASKVHKPIETVQKILNSLVSEKRFLSRTGSETDGKYRMYKLMIGIFEYCLIRPSVDTLTDWHRRFAALFEDLFATGYLNEYFRKTTTPLLRYLPINKVVQAHPMALPSDKLEIVLDRFKDFAVALCQCRLSAQIVGHSCGKPLLNCATMGIWAQKSIHEGWMKRVTKNEMLEIKREAEDAGLVNWMMNVKSTKSQSSCSCCGCCCNNLRMITEYSAPSMIAPPHFIPICNTTHCTFCGRCAHRCPMAAIGIDLKQKTWKRLDERCIGCGQCVVACDKKHALRLEAVPSYKLPYASWFSFITQATPGHLKNVMRVYRKRKKQMN